MHNRRKRFRVKFPNRFRTPQLLGLLIIFQIFTVIIFLFTWPSSVTLSFVAPFEEVKYWAPIIKNFEKQYPGIQIELLDDPEFIYTTDNVEVIYTSDLQNGAPQYDLIYMDIIWVSGFAEKGWLKDLSEFISTEELSEFLTSEVEAGHYQNRLYRIPFRSDVGMIFYNKRLLEKGGYQLPEELPKTLKRLKEISKDLQRQQIAKWGYLWQGRKYEGLITTFVEVLDSYGGYWIDLDKDNDNAEKVGLDKDAAVKAIKFLRDIITPNIITTQVESSSEGEVFDQEISPSYVLSSSEQKSFEEYEVGETVFLRGWSYFWKLANRAESPLKGDFEVIPASSFKGRGCRGGWGFGMAQKTKHPKEAWQAIQYFTSEAIQRQFVLDSGYLPSRKALFEDAAILKQYPHFSKLLKTLEANSVFRPQFFDYDQASKILQAYLWEVLVGEQTPENAMKQAALETRDLLAKSNSRVSTR